MTEGYDFYDEEAVFDRYIARRERADNPNDTIEAPVFMTLMGDFQGSVILDLGCGAGGFGVQLLTEGCKSYIGLEASARMFALAQPALSAVNGEVHQVSIEDWTYPAETFDRVVSRLVLHYIDDVQALFKKVYTTLKPGGHFIFSVEHPVITSSNAAASTSGLRQQWIVDDYFVRGRRNVTWMDSEVIKYHRTVEDYFMGLQDAGFSVNAIREPQPQREMIADETLYRRRQRIPLFLLLSGQRV